MPSLPTAPQPEPILAFIGQLGWFEITVLLVLGVLIFGSRLPQVGRNLGKGIVEFKKGLQGITDEIDKASEEDSKAKPRDQAKISERNDSVVTEKAKDSAEV